MNIPIRTLRIAVMGAAILTLTACAGKLTSSFDSAKADFIVSATIGANDQLQVRDFYRSRRFGFSRRGRGGFGTARQLTA